MGRAARMATRCRWPSLPTQPSTTRMGCGGMAVASHYLFHGRGVAVIGTFLAARRELCTLFFSYPHLSYLISSLTSARAISIGSALRCCHYHCLPPRHLAGDDAPLAPPTGLSLPIAGAAVRRPPAGGAASTAASRRGNHGILHMLAGGTKRTYSTAGAAVAGGRGCDARGRARLCNAGAGKRAA